jgi:hypothetical protein
MATPAGHTVGPELVRLLGTGPARGAAALVRGHPAVRTGSTTLIGAARAEAGPVGRRTAVATETRPVGRGTAVADEAGLVAAGVLMSRGTTRGRHLPARHLAARHLAAR